MPFSTSSAPTFEFANGLPAPKARDWFDPKIDVMNQRGRGYGLVHMPEAEAYLNTLLGRIKTSADVANWPGQVYLLATPALEAYATAAGNIYIGVSWLSSVDSEDELVALLAHEFGHVYLHYHQIDGAVLTADETARLATIGVALSQKAVQSTGWSNALSVQLAYTVGRELALSSWGKGQESSADALSLYLGHKLGYSYEYGLKSLLERLATWEDENEERKTRLEKEYLESVRKEAADAARRRHQGGGLVADLAASLDSTTSAGLTRFERSAQRGVAQMSVKHPEIKSRMDALAKIVESRSEFLIDREPRLAELKKLRSSRTFTTITTNYKYAFEAMGSLGSQKALQLALNASKGPTSTHAYPAIALYRARVALLAQGARVGGPIPRDPGVSLDGNISSEHDRAWIAVVERANQRIGQGDQRGAERLLTSAWEPFKSSYETWPDFIRYAGQLKGWGQAKTLAETCVNNLPKNYHKACTMAALAPAEQAEIQRQTEKNTEALTKKLFGK